MCQMIILYDMRYAKYSFFLFKALEDGGKYHFYSKKFSECPKYAEMICKHFEKNCTGSEMKKNTFYHLEFALTWPTMSYVLTVQCMLYFVMNNFFLFYIFLAHKVLFVLDKDYVYSGAQKKYPIIGTKNNSLYIVAPLLLYFFSISNN